MIFFLMLSTCLLSLPSLNFAIQIPRTIAPAPSIPAKFHMISLTPGQAPAYSPQNHGYSSHPSESKHHRRGPHRFPPPSFTRPQDPVECDKVSCSDPFTLTPIGSPCGCVLPMQVELDLNVAPYQLFSRIAELEVEVAAGIFLKQCQVRIMGASPSIRDAEKTTVTIDLVPLGEKFDNMTALLTYERFRQRKVQINMSVFGDYNVIYVQYPGLPFSTPTIDGELLSPSSNGGLQYLQNANLHASEPKKINPKIVTVIALSSSILILLCFGFVCVFWRYKRVGRSSTAIGPALPLSVTRRAGIRSIIYGSLRTASSCNSSVKTFSIAELKKATNEFSSERILGEGGFGRVYLGSMEDASEVAIKLLIREDSGDCEFIAEVEMLSRLHHRNLVKLIGICIEGHNRCLVYELIRNGSVESHLHGANRMKAPLDWDTRMKIALGAARGLAYLHEDSNPQVIHRDFKASNVLLEEDFTPKVSDFGLAREALEGIHHVSTQLMGTFGYVAPEYAMTGHLLVKSDVYSYGVMLLELLSGRKPVDMSQPHGSENLVTWARPLLTTREGLHQLIDPSLGPNYDFDMTAKVAAIASLCMHNEASHRPFMGEVVQALKLIYNVVNETQDDSCSQLEESPCLDFGLQGDCSPECSWWNGSTPTRDYTKEYSPDYFGEVKRPHSESLSGEHNCSGPLRTKRKKSDYFYRLRGSRSEHGYQQYRVSCYDGS